MSLSENLSKQLNAYAEKQESAIRSSADGLTDEQSYKLHKDAHEEWIKAIKIAGEALIEPCDRKIVASEIKTALLSVREAFAKIDSDEGDGTPLFIGFTQDVLQYPELPKYEPKKQERLNK